MLRQPAMRASDVDREAAVELLRTHHDQGRLTLDEYTDRIGAAYSAVTLGELAQLLKDLPPPEHLEYDVEVLRAAWQRSAAVQPVAPPSPRPTRAEPPVPPPVPVVVPVPVPVRARQAREEREERRRGVSARSVLRGLWTAVLAVTAVNVAIWLLVLVTEQPVYFWPIWVFGPPAALLGAAELCVRRHSGPGS
ncbi:DUF1707 SHOCT-like domain-containing protein [Streptodolium elevatio]|uniref:DUF1707 domain-containing protein n=1 Tax=Streptodolium elevatio TaxID=3157996 RepID=A0ABV3DPR6_9ACTN